MVTGGFLSLSNTLYDDDDDDTCVSSFLFPEQQTKLLQKKFQIVDTIVKVEKH
jgi:hypothetical protein